MPHVASDPLLAAAHAVAPSTTSFHAAFVAKAVLCVCCPRLPASGSASCRFVTLLLSLTCTQPSHSCPLFATSFRAWPARLHRRDDEPSRAQQSISLFKLPNVVFVSENAHAPKLWTRRPWSLPLPLLLARLPPSRRQCRSMETLARRSVCDCRRAHRHAVSNNRGNLTQLSSSSFRCVVVAALILAAIDVDPSASVLPVSEAGAIAAEQSTAGTLVWASRRVRTCSPAH